MLRPLLLLGLAQLCSLHFINYTFTNNINGEVNSLIHRILRPEYVQNGDFRVFLRKENNSINKALNHRFHSIKRGINEIVNNAINNIYSVNGINNIVTNAINNITGSAVNNISSNVVNTIAGGGTNNINTNAVNTILADVDNNNVVAAVDNNNVDSMELNIVTIDPEAAHTGALDYDYTHNAEEVEDDFTRKKMKDVTRKMDDVTTKMKDVPRKEMKVVTRKREDVSRKMKDVSRKDVVCGVGHGACCAGSNDGCPPEAPVCSEVILHFVLAFFC